MERSLEAKIGTSVGGYLTTCCDTMVTDYTAYRMLVKTRRLVLRGYCCQLHVLQ